ncbi:hypothetical protein M413DRAFT_387940 [Hebeloma cylindrosporum]|uniref:Uncharacterized protein n=1 Tax=Hebeloma cylindrosporum TaxID=76867 RepID=A0A0C2YRU2_HEBCY|nr:hypothetical protein M413DRAFT_387940 [Hebeloma cylindrosporum h7]
MHHTPSSTQLPFLLVLSRSQSTELYSYSHSCLYLSLFITSTSPFCMLCSPYPGTRGFFWLSTSLMLSTLLCNLPDVNDIRCTMNIPGTSMYRFLKSVCGSVNDQY